VAAAWTDEWALAWTLSGASNSNSTLLMLVLRRRAAMHHPSARARRGRAHWDIEVDKGATLPAEDEMEVLVSNCDNIPSEV